jgi:hypothetical protein
MSPVTVTMKHCTRQRRLSYSDFRKSAYLSPTLAQVELDGGVGVDGVPLVRIDRHTEQARVGLHRFTNRTF